MHITAIEVYVLQSPLAQSFGWSQGWIDRRTTSIAKVVTDEGVVGWGEGAGGASALVAGKSAAELLIGKDPLNRTGLWQILFSSKQWGAINAIDIALWDIAGKATGLPVATLLGGRLRDKVAVYATGLYYTEGEFPDRLLAEARGYVEAGYKGMKTKVGGLPLQEDVERVAALREVIGPDVYLMVDANQAYNAATAIRIGERLADYDILWFEEPVDNADLEAYLQVKAALPMAIAGGEGLRTRYQFKEFLARRAFDIAQPDVQIVGGITEMRRVADIANAFDIQVNPHVWASPIMIAATLHVTATIPPCPPARVSLPFLQEPVMEFDRTPSAIREELCDEPFDQVDGYVDVPNAPGLGINVNEKVVQRLSVAHERYG